MVDLPHPWDAYLRLQKQLASKSSVDHQAWGLETALDAILESVAAHASIDDSDIERAVASGARQSRHRALLRAIHLHDEIETDDSIVIPVAEVRESLQAMTACVANDDLALLHDVAAGCSYAEIARERAVSAGSLRVRVSRLRTSLAALAA